MRKERLNKFVSNVLLHYMFGAHTPATSDFSQIKVYHSSIDEYIEWVKTRIDQLSYEFDDGELSAYEILRLDKKLLGIFPFMGRVLDRTELISDTVNFFKELSSIVESPVRVPSPIVNLVVTSKPVDIKVASVESKSSEVDDGAVAEEVDDGAVAEEVDDGAVAEEVVVESKKVAVKLRDKTPPQKVTAPKRLRVPLDQSIHKLRKIVADLGVKGARLMSKSELSKILIKYNNGESL